MISLKEFDHLIRTCVERIKNNAATNIAANPEDQLKRPISDFIESLFINEIITKTETPVEGLGARPDIGVARKNLLCGYIELKAPGVSIKSFKGPNAVLNKMTPKTTPENKKTL
ncbi:MAG: hypothetical protein ABSF81_17105 [Bacteroidales bacterium]|jgi:hypothetical protein